ncbi:MAG: FeoB-associated Cys-rich membrane protein [Pyrinomonadaceae bacterium]
MNVQNIIVAIIILSALVYVGSILLRKVKSFSSKSGCGADCGCDGKQKSKIAKV